MLTLNLLSTEQKKEMKFRRSNTYIKQTIFVLIITFALSGVIFVGAKIILENNYNKVAGIVNQQNDHEFSQKITEINSLSEFINTLENNYYEWSELLIDISDRATTGIKISSLEINQDNESASIRGLASTRQELLDYKNSLEKIIFLKNVKLPIQQLSQKENINFIINMELNLENFYK